MRLQLNQSAARCSSDSFGSADDIHLRKDRFHVRFHSALTNKEQARTSKLSKPRVAH
jgi:hypothetical protein